MTAEWDDTAWEEWANAAVDSRYGGRPTPHVDLLEAADSADAEETVVVWVSLETRCISCAIE